MPEIIKGIAIIISFILILLGFVMVKVSEKDERFLYRGVWSGGIGFFILPTISLIEEIYNLL